MLERRTLRAFLPYTLTLAALMAFGSQRATAQGILTVTPARTSSTAAGNGGYGYTGNGGAATAATLALPSAVAYDAAGDIFLADANNHVVREVVKASGNIVTVAGTGVQGFSGDGGAATAAQLDTPTGVAVDAAGNLLIADSHNNRVRKVTGSTITTVAGGGVATGSGPLPATTVALALPTAVAVDAADNVYIADTNNHVVRKLTGTTIATVAGNGEQLLAGDGGAATAASLNAPTGVAVDASGNLYIADRLNQRVRVVNTSGVISTLAGSGVPTFAGGFAGDGAAATAASLSRPTGVSVDAAGNVYVADSSNQRVREIGNGGIATVAGNGEQGNGASFSSPRSVATDAVGNVAVADTLNQRVVAATQPTLTFTPQGVGTPSASQSITLANSGNASLTLTQPAISANFATAAGGTCPAGTITLSAGASCTVNLAYVQTINGATSGSVTFGGTNTPSQTVLLATSPYTGAPRTGSTATLTSSQALPLVGQPITYSLQVASQNSVGTPSGTLTLTANGVAIGTATLTNGVAQIVRSFGAAGPEVIVASYSGDTYYAPSSISYTQTVEGFTLSPQSAVAQTVIPGAAATYALTISPVAGPFTYPVTFTATGAPAGAVVSFTPATVTPGATAANVTMKVQTPALSAALRRSGTLPTGAVAVALLLLPFSGRLRRRVRVLSMVAVAFASLLVMSGLAGCGSSSGYFGQPLQNYNIVVTATGTGVNGATLQQTTTVQLTVQ